MWKYKITLTSLLLLFAVLSIHAQEEEVAEDTVQVKSKVLELGFAFDYLKLHTLALEESEKWEAAFNITLFNHYAVIAEVGTASLSPEDAYYNADYLSEGNYYRIGMDYQINVNPSNFIMLGLRYSRSDYNEQINYRFTNPLYPEQTGSVKREALQAEWYELVITSEKAVKRILKNEVRDFMSIGFKFRLKTRLQYTNFDFIQTKQIPGFGDPVNKLNPEINLYLKIRLSAIKKMQK